MKYVSLKRKKSAAWIIGVVAACILIFLGVQNIDVLANAVAWAANVIMPLILGLVTALILNVPMRFFERHIWAKTNKKVLKKLRRPVSFVISLVLIVGIIIGIVWLVIPELVNAVKIVVQGVIGFVSQLNSMDEAALSAVPFGSMLADINWDEIINKLQAWLKDQSGTIVNTAVGTIGSVVGGVFDFFISIVFSIYILFSKEKLKAQVCRVIKAWIPPKAGEWMIHAARVAGINFGRFVAGQTLEAVVLGTLCVLGMLIFGIPYAPMVGTLVGVTALIPVVGAFIGAIVGAFMIVTVDPVKALVFIIFLVVLQQIEGNLIYPKVMGSQVELPAMWILAAVTIGGGIAGAAGMLLAVPVASTAYVLLREATEQREKKLNA